jgi:hypothetical protein
MRNFFLSPPSGEASDHADRLHLSTWLWDILPGMNAGEDVLIPRKVTDHGVVSASEGSYSVI